MSDVAAQSARSAEAALANAAPLVLPDISKADLSRWLGKDPAPLKFTIEGLVPEGMTTLLVAEGGAGKSLLMQLACATIPVGISFCGHETAGGSSAGVFAEDTEAILHLRQQRICESLDVDMEAYVGRAFILSYAGQYAPLWENGAPTKFMGELEAQLHQIEELRLLTLDNAALLYAGNENDRLEVTQFLQALNGMAQRVEIGIVLSTHQSKTRDGSTLRVASGTTAWVNASRCVLELKPEHDDESPVLRVIKANHSRPGLEIPLRWENGVLGLEPEPDSMEQRIKVQRIDRLVFDRVESAWENDWPLTSTPQQPDRFLPKILAKDSEFKVDEIKIAMLMHLDNGNLRMDQRTTRTPKGLRVSKRPQSAQKQPVSEARAF